LLPAPQLRRPEKRAMTDYSRETRVPPRFAFHIAFSVAAFLLATGLAAADGLQAGYWKVTSRPEINGQAAPPNERMRCLTPAEVADIGKTFSPEASTQNAQCERVEHEVTATSLKWRLTCTGQVNMDVAGAFSFDTPQHYSAEVRTQMTMGGPTMTSRVRIEGERVGECP
jgi:hypothetical protein